MKNYPMEINGWNYSLDADSMGYYKEFDNHYKAVCLFWLDTVRGDDGYNPEGDCWIGLVADGNTLADAIEMLGIMPFEIVHPMRREEAEKELIKYMEMH